LHLQHPITNFLAAAICILCLGSNASTLLSVKMQSRHNMPEIHSCAHFKRPSPTLTLGRHCRYNVMVWRRGEDTNDLMLFMMPIHASCVSACAHLLDSPARACSIRTACVTHATHEASHLSAYNINCGRRYKSMVHLLFHMWGMQTPAHCVVHWNFENEQISISNAHSLHELYQASQSHIPTLCIHMP
jgi:hypothetical protein